MQFINNRRALFVTLLAGLLLAIGVGTWLVMGDRGTNPDQDLLPPQNDSQIDDIKIPQDEIIQEEPEEQPTQEDEQPAQAPVKDTVYPFISGWNKSGNSLTIRGYVSGVIEEGGTCQFIVLSSSGDNVADQSSKGISAGTNTSCPEVTINLSGLPSGNYTMLLQYESQTKQGKSPPMEGLTI